MRRGAEPSQHRNLFEVQHYLIAIAFLFPRALHLYTFVSMH